MKKPPLIRCAIYTRKSSEEGLEQSFNSLDAQREACTAYIASQAHEGWRLIDAAYDDGGFSGGSMERPGLQRLLDDLGRGRIDVVVVYKVDRLTRSLADFARIVEILDARGASFVSVTQHFNTTSSMGRLTLNVLLSFAQFEREVTGERIRDKFAASRRKGLWMGGNPPLGYDVADRKLVVNEEEAERVRAIFERYAELGSVKLLAANLQDRGVTSKRWTTQGGGIRGGVAFSRGALYKLLNNRVYRGEAMHKGTAHPGEHAAIVPEALWERAQAVMEANRVERATAERATAPSSLAGLLFDDRGNPMSPSHASKKGRRYRYYVSQAVLNHRPEAAGSLTRVPAQAVEELVLDRVSALLTAAEQRRWTAAAPVERAERLAALLQRVELGSDRVRITVRRLDGVEARAAARIMSPHDRLVESGDTLVLEVAARLKTWGGERVIVGPDGRELREQPQVDDTLMKALARAHRWCRQLASGEVASVAALAETAGCTPAYVTQLLSLAFLAPDIVELILRGAQPKRLTLAALLAAKLPLSWREQRRVLGLSATQ